MLYHIVYRTQPTLAPSCEQQALRDLATGFAQREMAHLLVKEEKCRPLAI